MRLVWRCYSVNVVGLAVSAGAAVAVAGVDVTAITVTAVTVAAQLTPDSNVVILHGLAVAFDVAFVVTVVITVDPAPAPQREFGCCL